jgi:hypothetical protein
MIKKVRNKMLSLDEAIKYEEMVADACESTARMCALNDPYEKDAVFENSKCAEKHRQLAEWLKELKKLKKLACCEDCVSRKVAKEDMQELVDDAVKELVLENAR